MSFVHHKDPPPAPSSHRGLSRTIKAPSMAPELPQLAYSTESFDDVVKENRVFDRNVLVSY